MEYNKQNLDKKTINKRPQKFKNYCCPFCLEIPEILNFDEINNNISLKCPTHGKNIINNNSYLELISKLLASSKNENNNICNKHKKNFEIYCKTCEMNLCINCIHENKDHLNHLKFKILDICPSTNEIIFINNKINIFLEEKEKLIKKLENLNNKIIFFDTILNGIEKDTTNYFKNINVKHLIYGEDIDFMKIYKETSEPLLDIKKIKIDEIFNEKTIDFIKNKNELLLINKKARDEFISPLFNNSLIDIINENHIKLKIDISFLNENILQNLKVINLKGNKIESLNFLSNKNFHNLEFLGLNDNNIKDIEPLKQLNAPLIKQIYLSKNNIDSIKAFENIKMNYLQILWLSDNSITSIDSFKNCHIQKLEKLGMNKNKINNIKVFKYAKFPLLMELYINDNDIDYEISENKEVIKMLENKIEDFFY